MLFKPTAQEQNLDPAEEEGPWTHLLWIFSSMDLAQNALISKSTPQACKRAELQMIGWLRTKPASRPELDDEDSHQWSE